MLNSVLGWILAAVVLGAAALVVNAILLLLRFGNVKTLMFLRKLNVVLRGVPDGMLLLCTRDQVSALAYDSGDGDEKLVPLYTGVLTWRGGPRLAAKIKKRAARQITVRTTIFALLFVPLVAAGAWVTLFVSWHGIWILLVLVLHQIMPFRIWAWPGFESAFDRD